MSHKTIDALTHLFLLNGGTIEKLPAKNPPKKRIKRTKKPA